MPLIHENRQNKKVLKIYASIMGASAPLLKMLLHRRCKAGKEDEKRLPERMGVAARSRPEGPLLWVHAASVGESQSALILINAILEQNPDLHILVTTGTVTSAELMAKRLPPQAFHQYYPLDNPQWINRFLNHWQPDFALWMESELWPNMIAEIRKREIPCVLVNARLSEKSFKNWSKSGSGIRRILEAFSLIMAQTEEEAERFRKLGALNVTVTDNLKYSAAPLPFEQAQLDKLKGAIKDRPLWFYASTHEGEEDIACILHHHLKRDLPELLTIIAPRHPERRDKVMALAEKHELQAVARGSQGKLPEKDDDLYIVDTMGELGLFYRLAPVACIGRSLSQDGGGGHNPIEAAQLECAVLHGPRIQNLQRIYDEMDGYGAALKFSNEQKLEEMLRKLLTDEEALHVLQNKAVQFSSNKARVLERVMKHLGPLLQKNGLFPSFDTGHKKVECA